MLHSSLELYRGHKHYASDARVAGKKKRKKKKRKKERKKEKKKKKSSMFRKPIKFKHSRIRSRVLPCVKQMDEEILTLARQRSERA